MYQSLKTAGLYHLAVTPTIFNNQRLSEDRIDAMQNNKLRKLVRHAHEKVPYYRQLFGKANVDYRDIRKKEHLAQIPILTKTAVNRNYPDKILAGNIDYKRCSERETSGSSGNIINVVLDLHVTYQYHLQQLRQIVQIGYLPTDTIAYIRYSSPATSTVLQKIGLFRREYVQLTLSPRKQIRRLLAINPNIINAYPSVLYLLAKNITKTEAERLNLKFILSNSEMLYPYMRSRIESTFGCKVYDDYSCLEFSSIGYECKKQKMHVTADNVIVEVVDDSDKPVPPGVEGRLVITALNNYAMPFIRYDIGDVGTLLSQKCTCGCHFPIFKNIAGRRDDYLLMPNDTLLDPQSAVFQVEIVPGVKEFQILQKTKEKLLINVVANASADHVTIKDAICSNMRKVVLSSIAIDIHIVETLNRTETGKRRAVRSFCI